MPTQATIVSHSLVEETCPYVDEIANEMISDILSLVDVDRRIEVKIENIIKNAIESIKSGGTIPLREALTSKCDQVIDLEEELHYTKLRLEDLERESSQ